MDFVTFAPTLCVVWIKEIMELWHGIKESLGMRLIKFSLEDNLETETEGVKMKNAPANIPQLNALCHWEVCV